MTHHAIQSLVKADDEAEETCKKVKDTPNCENANTLMQHALGLSVEACLAQKRDAQCDTFFKRFPKYKSKEMTCSPYDVCRTALQRTMAKGCERFGVQVGEGFLNALQRAGVCAITRTCIEGQLLEAFKAAQDPAAAVAHAGVASASNLVQLIRRDRKTLDAIACLDPETQAQFSCYLVVQYGGAAMGVKSLIQAGAGAMLADMSSLEADVTLSRTAAQAAPAESTSSQFAKRLEKTGDIEDEFGYRYLSVKDAPPNQGHVTFRTGVTESGERVVVIENILGIKNEAGIGQALQNELIQRYPDATFVARLVHKNYEGVMSAIEKTGYNGNLDVSLFQQSVPIMRNPGFDYTIEYHPPNSPGFNGTVTFKMKANPQGKTTLTLAQDTLNGLRSQLIKDEIDSWMAGVPAQ